MTNDKNIVANNNNNDNNNDLNFNHISVLLNECIDNLNIKADGVYVDGTMGGAGHSLEIVKKLSAKGKLICIDQDNNAHTKAREVLKDHLDKVIFVHDNFVNIKNILTEVGYPKVDGVLLDLGVSSHQLDEAERGFSYMQDARLDMRMDVRNKLSAYEVVNEYSEEKLAEIIKIYGEDNWAKRIAKFIVEFRAESPIETTADLVDVIRRAIPKAARQEGSHPAKRTFQAIRIEVNNELGILDSTVEDIKDCLNPKGRICIITFHSLEDRAIKRKFVELNNNCICPREFPVCVCDKEEEVKIISRKPILPSKEELEYNSRSKSAKLRVAERTNYEE